MDFDLDSNERARKRARNAAMHVTAALIVVLLFTAFPARAAGGAGDDITKLSLDGKVNRVAVIHALNK
jgi:hypothetical protein